MKMGIIFTFAILSADIYFKKKEMKNKELIKNISQTISKELKKPNGGNKKLIDTLQKILDKAS